ncbi:DUF7853 family protein [Natrarchaeobius chitinivorans]|uniref:Uncharacterized protein n=1 Tax=Natrarchaeobius chitinivorans TaxID=1679083 RepID=A0A3N6LU54_NATCH|nr:hypothetical protein [Natrarchaeobius chitinivorans]RQG91064.1 hypothetical protein EA473_19175 [Natrarchaeobius chitinivorans]
MSSTPSEAETHEVALSREEQWVVHHVLAARVDDALDADETPPAWALAAFDAIESDENPETFTHRQVRRIANELSGYLDSETTPEQDLVHGSSVLERFEDRLHASS